MMRCGGAATRFAPFTACCPDAAGRTLGGTIERVTDAGSPAYDTGSRVEGRESVGCHERIQSFRTGVVG